MTKLSFPLHRAFICCLFNYLVDTCGQNIRIMQKLYCPLIPLALSGLLAFCCAGLAQAQNYRFLRENPVDDERG
jgi:hypothetical protein